jgi:periplasmic protein CpxP/Spy
MNKERFYQFTIILMLVTNLALCYFLFSTGGRGRKAKPFPEQLIEKLKFNDVQREEFMASLFRHRTAVDSVSDEVRARKKVLYMTKDLSTYSKDSISDEIGNLVASVDKINLQHFVEIKQICDSEQVKGYDEIIAQLNHNFTEQNKRLGHAGGEPNN